MDASFFIAGRLRFKGKIAMICIAVSCFVMIVAVAISSGFRHEIRSGLSEMSGDVLICPSDLNVFNESRPVESDASYVQYVSELDCVDRIVPVIYKAGIVKAGTDIYGVVFKASETSQADTSSLSVSIPGDFAERASLQAGDRMLTYFVSDKVSVRNFTVTQIYDPVMETDDNPIIYASISDLQRLNGWSGNQVSALEVILDRDVSDEAAIRDSASEIGAVINAFMDEDQEHVVSSSAPSRFPQMFSWLDLIDFNVFVILLLMTIVAGFNMVSGLLIMLFENISTIGLLKSLGMRDKGIFKAFLTASSAVVLKGMAAGNLLAVGFCLLQQTTHMIKLDPENYYVSSVPVHLDFADILLADVASFLVIMLFLLIPSFFISKVDPAHTVRVR